jgi:hypothetical protein
MATLDHGFVSNQVLQLPWYPGKFLKPTIFITAKTAVCIEIKIYSRMLGKKTDGLLENLKILKLIFV